MYELPSEDPKEAGLPDEFHDLQPQLLSRTLRLVDYASDRLFSASDLNLYYNSDHPRWHKRPDWFLVVDVPRLYQQQDLRNSFVVWNEGKAPSVIVELLSPGREADDLGPYVEELIEAPAPELLPYTIEDDESGIEPPSKWEVYEQVLQVPHYLVFSRYTNRLRYFQLTNGQYQEQAVDQTNPRAWIADLKIGLGLWDGAFEGIMRPWLRWYDTQGNWILTDAEQAQAQLRQAVVNLLGMGMTPEQVATITSLPVAQVRSWTE